jgi:predicted dehydrogenase
MADRALKVGVIGVGFGMVHVPGFQAEGWDVVAVCSRTEDKVKRAAAEFEIPYTYTDYRALIARDDIDVVSIVTPVNLHYEITMAALSAGKSVLCEKPLAMNVKQAREMLEKAWESGLTAMVDHEPRFAPQRAYVKELLSQGYVGTPILVTQDLLYGPTEGLTPRLMTWQAWAHDGGGILAALGSHHVDNLRFWLGEFSSISGRLSTLHPQWIDSETGKVVMGDSDDTFSFSATLANGTIATMTASRAAPFGPGARIEVFGTDGMLSTPQHGFNAMPDGKVFGARFPDKEVKELPMPERFRPFDDPRDRRSLPFRLLLRELAKGVRTKTSPAPNFEDGYRCQQVLDAIRESSRFGRQVDIRKE